MEKLVKKMKVKKMFKKKSDKKKVERKKPDKTKRGRLFIKNLSFKITEKEFKDHFSQFGNIVDAQLLKNADGKLKGCGFINYEKKISAIQAILKSNKKPFKERMISVDWAVPKTKFEKSKSGTVESDLGKNEKKEDNDEGSEDECEILNDEDSEDEKPELSDLEHLEEEVKPDPSSAEDSDDSELVEAESSSSEEEVDVKEEESHITKNEETTRGDNKKAKVKSNDVAEGKTVFLRNLPFHVDNSRLKQLMTSQFGPNLMYALVCMDPLTEHSKGTGFVKFKTVENAEECINKGSMLVDGETVTFHPAMDRKQLDLQKESKDKKFKDSRNLYLVKEGVVMAGSRAAADVSVPDMTKRVQLEQWKTQMLRNLHMFVSKTRLIIHNLPPDWNDAMLRAMFKKHSPPNAVIREAKVMRNIRDVDEKGIGRSKEHGFVSYTTHEDALQSIRNVNNNPTIFTRAKRPIVAFSIENRAILNAKLKRTERSKQNNPHVRDKYLAEKKQELMKNKGRGKGEKQKYRVQEVKQRQKQDSTDGCNFKGQVAAPSQNISFAKNHKLNKQLEVHKGQVQRCKKEHRQQKRKKMNKMKTKDPIKTKPNLTKQKLSDDKQFNKLISSYKNKLSSASSSTSATKRWYET